MPPYDTGGTVSMSSRLMQMGTGLPPGKETISPTSRPHAGGYAAESGFGAGPLPKALEKRMNEKGVSIQTGPPPPPAPPRDMQYEGSVKSLSERHGKGFIACEQVNRVYGRDVYIPKEMVGDLKVLDRVRFTIQLSDKGHPQATSVTKIAVPGS